MDGMMQLDTDDTQEKGNLLMGDACMGCRLLAFFTFQNVVISWRVDLKPFIICFSEFLRPVVMEEFLCQRLPESYSNGAFHAVHYYLIYPGTVNCIFMVSGNKYFPAELVCFCLFLCFFSVFLVFSRNNSKDTIFAQINFRALIIFMKLVTSWHANNLQSFVKQNVVFLLQ